jgi:hypothetical protein
LVFAVLLGDCAVPSASRNRNAIVREPRKPDHLKRHKDDMFFDSIVGRPADAHEFVVYNKDHCVPMYAISYTNQHGGNPSPNSLYNQHRTYR